MKLNLRSHSPRPPGGSPDPTEGEIQHGAYFLWEELGRPTGRDLDIWLAARERLRHRPLAPARRRICQELPDE